MLLKPCSSPVRGGENRYQRNLATRSPFVPENSNLVRKMRERNRSQKWRQQNKIHFPFLSGWKNLLFAPYTENGKRTHVHQVHRLSITFSSFRWWKMQMRLIGRLRGFCWVLQHEEVAFHTGQKVKLGPCNCSKFIRMTLVKLCFHAHYSIW